MNITKRIYYSNCGDGFNGAIIYFRPSDVSIEDNFEEAKFIRVIRILGNDIKMHAYHTEGETSVFHTSHFDFSFIEGNENSYFWYDKGSDYLIAKCQLPKSIFDSLDREFAKGRKNLSSRITLYIEDMSSDPIKVESLPNKIAHKISTIKINMWIEKGLRG